METKPLPPLSASKIKTFENCSWLYWSEHHLKLPKLKNDGARKGDVCHTVFEILLNKDKHHKHFKKILKSDTITASPPVSKLVRKLMLKVGLPFTMEGFAQIDKMIVVGLRSDFYAEGGTLLSPEFRFDHTELNEKGEALFRIKGFMDKPFKRDKTLYIDDYKSSKKKFEGEDQESNLQALIYSYMALKLWPDFTPKVRFIFLQFANDPIEEVSFTKDALRGLKYYLIEMQNKVNKFTKANAMEHLAAYEPTPKTGEFKGQLLCGFAKTPGQLKKDGTKMFHCPYKFPFYYYTVKKADGSIAYSVMDKKEAKLKPGEVIEPAIYKGCPAFNKENVIESFEGSSKKTYANVLDEF